MQNDDGIEQYIKDFLEAVYPGAVNLALSCFNEKTALIDATKTIKDLQSKLSESFDLNTSQAKKISDLQSRIKRATKELKSFTGRQKVNGITTAIQQKTFILAEQAINQALTVLEGGKE